MATFLEEFVRPPLAPRRQREAYIRQFKLEQMTFNEWISFERTVSCLTGQKDLNTSDDARRTLLDAICAGKIHRDNPRALQCLDASSGDDWHWSVSDFNALVDHHEGLEATLKNTYFERHALLKWMKGCGFEPTADIKNSSFASADQSEAPFRELPNKRPRASRIAECQVYDLLFDKHRDRKIPRVKFESIRDCTQTLLDEQIKRGVSLDPNLRTIGIDAVRRAFGKKP